MSDATTPAPRPQTLNGATPGCNFKDITGQRFGRLTAMRLSHHGKGGYLWACRCDCGALPVILGHSLRGGMTHSCGCLQKERAAENGRTTTNPEGRMTSTRLYSHRKSQGLCPGCGGARDGERVQCSACLKKSRARQGGNRHVVTARRKLAGLCPECGGTRDGEWQHCSRCRMRQREAQKHWRKRISGRACPHCRTDLPADYDGKKVCPSCLAKIVADRKDRVAKGLCCKCSAPAAVGKKWPRCLDCWWKGQSTAHTGTVRNADALKSLWESQGRRCFYTGKPLTPGVNMWLDHSKPRSRGGDSAFENLRWVTKRANLAKNDCTHEEFLALCRLVAGRFPNA